MKSVYGKTLVLCVLTTNQVVNGKIVFPNLLTKKLTTALEKIKVHQFAAHTLAS